jgi:uncharacterized membrane protein YphA (DoxX/SURF4 family)
MAWVWLSGAAMIAAAAAMLSGKYDKLAAALLAAELLLFVVMIHLPRSMRQDPTALNDILKDLALAGAAMLYATHVAKDTRGIG